MDALAQLHTQIRACRLCLEAGYTIAPGPVFSGPGSDRGARVMLIGQAPGVTEAQVKRPFNAGSGRRLFTWLQQAGWQEYDFRASAYMTAVTKCYPGRSHTGERQPAQPLTAATRERHTFPSSDFGKFGPPYSGPRGCRKGT